MKKDRILKAIVAVQAICMILLAIVVLIKVLHPAMFSPSPHRIAPGNGGASGERIAAKIGEETISEREYLAELNRQYGAEVLRTMMLRRVVRLEAQADGITVSGTELADELSRMMEGYEDEQAYYDAMKAQLGMSKADVQADTEYRLLLEKLAIRGITITDEQVQDYIRTHPDEFKPVSQLRLSWIVTETKEEADRVLSMADSGEDFAALARTYSTDSFTAESGGDLGTVDEDDPFLNREMMKAARTMEVGQIGGPVKTDTGWAVFQLAERTTTSSPQGQAREDAVRKQLALSEAPPLTQVEDELLAKYRAVASPQTDGGGEDR